MRILTLDNRPYDLDHLPEEVDDMRFAILDNSDPANPDYHYIPLIFLESFKIIIASSIRSVPIASTLAVYSGTSKETPT